MKELQLCKYRNEWSLYDPNSRTYWFTNAKSTYQRIKKLKQIMKEDRGK